MKLFVTLVFSITVLALNGCSKPGPEEVVIQFERMLADGHCDSAKSLVIKDATDQLQGSIDAGCFPYKMYIASMSCSISEEDEDIAQCEYARQIPGQSGETFFDYDLERIKGQWKIARVKWDW